MRFQNRVAQVTGVGSGIGGTTAEAIVEDGGEAVAVTCDIRSPDDLVP